MSAIDKYDDDDYVAKLLAEDAKRSSMKYASAGLSALLPKRPSGSAPKPNTRFLKNLVRETDMHNAALKKKEELEARIRLRKIGEKEDKYRDESNHNRDRKRRRLSDDHADIRRKDRQVKERRRRRDSISPEEADRVGSRHHRRSRNDQDASSPEPEHTNRNRSGSRKHKSQGSKAERSSDRDAKRHSRKHSRDDRLSHLSPRMYQASGRREQRSRSPCHRDEEVSARSKGSSGRLSKRQRSPSHSSFSDPLEDLVGPLPAKTPNSEEVKIRGRGAHKVPNSSSNIDDHFSSNYNPAHDVESNSYENAHERDDWDMALEALHDRSMWKRKQADRMRDAGWNDEEIAKWENSTAHKLNDNEGDLSQVKWAKKGESREWDRGKTLES